MHILICHSCMVSLIWEYLVLKISSNSLEKSAQIIDFAYQQNTQFEMLMITNHLFILVNSAYTYSQSNTVLVQQNNIK